MIILLIAKIVGLIIIGSIFLFLYGCNSKHPEPTPEPDPEPEPTPEDDWKEHYPKGYKIPIFDINKNKWGDRIFDSSKWKQYENRINEFMDKENRVEYDDYSLAKVMTHKENGEYFFVWTDDMVTWDKRDYWATPAQFVIDKGGLGDCLEENTEIMVKDGIKKIKDLKIGDLVLSYNYDLEQYEYKPVTKIWDKGVLDGYDIKLKNGHNIIATGEHRFFCRTSEDYPKKYEIKKFQDIDLNNWCKHQLHCVYKLPEGNIDIDKNWAYLVGIYISEGYSETSHVCIAQDKNNIRGKIEKALNNLHIPYSKSKRIKHAYYNILNSQYKDKFKELGNNSFNKQFPDNVLNWNNESLKFLVEGLLDGDGTDCTNYKDNFADGYIHHALWEFSTSSDQVAKTFNIIVRKVYGNIHYFKQLNHQGVGNKPIWRLRFNPKAMSNKREIFNGISTVSIAKKKIKEIKSKHYYDIEVQDNHNFVLADSGVISHNCDDMAGLHCDYLYRLGYMPIVFWLEIYWKRRVLNTLNNTYYWKDLGHAVTIYKRTPKDNWRCFSNQQWLGMSNGVPEIKDIVYKFVPVNNPSFKDDYELTKIYGRHPVTGKLLFEWRD